MKKLIIAAVAILLVVVGIYIFLQTQNGSQNQTVNNSDNIQQNTQESTVEGYSGKVLAGTSSPFIDFNKQDYEKALSSGKTIVLDFYANWCPTCRAEEPELFAGFNELNNPDVVGFRVNYNDSDTDSDEKALASEFNVPYQHTKLILVGGKEVARYPSYITKQEFIDAVNKVL